jgi:hypothetical protein
LAAVVTLRLARKHMGRYETRPQVREALGFEQIGADVRYGVIRKTRCLERYHPSTVGEERLGLRALASVDATMHVVAIPV